MVIDVVTASSGMSVEQDLHVAQRVDRNAAHADLAEPAGESLS
jgi:hypothetical protein